MKLAPIILFAYNRPWHTRQTLEALQRNELADQSILYIYADGLREGASVENEKAFNETRTVLLEQKWCKEVVVIERNYNFGLAENVINGVTSVLSKHQKVIVLEDDIVTSPYFLKFMNEGLEIYRDEKKVFGVSGYCFPNAKVINTETYFLPYMSSWGYGVWEDRWKKINFDGKDLLNRVEAKQVCNELSFGDINYHQMLKDQVDGKNNSWAVRFYVSMFFHKGLFLYPNISLLKNIGFDGTGVNCKADENTHFNNAFKKNSNVIVEKKPITELKHIEKYFKKDSPKAKTSFRKQIKKKVSILLGNRIKHYLKRKIGIKQQSSNSDLYAFLKQMPRYTRTSVILKKHQITIPDAASFLFMYKEIFKQEIYKFNPSNPKPYIIDAGANIGLSVIYFKSLFPDSNIVAFEPDDTIFKILQSNIKTFGYSNILLLKKGLWDSNTTLSFKFEGADAGILSELHDSNDSTSKVDVISLNPFLTKKVDLLKIDIEGAETVVLKNIENNLDVVDRIFVEYHSFVGQKQSLNQVIEILSKANFRLYMSIPGNNSIPSPFMGLPDYINMDFQLNIFGFKENLK